MPKRCQHKIFRNKNLVFFEDGYVLAAMSADFAWFSYQCYSSDAVLQFRRLSMSEDVWRSPAVQPKEEMQCYSADFMKFTERFWFNSDLKMMRKLKSSKIKQFRWFFKGVPLWNRNNHNFLNRFWCIFVRKPRHLSSVLFPNEQKVVTKGKW